MCGPSNPLQTFQKHSTVDRTLQQDRIVSRPSPSQGFRSSPGPNGGLVDREFEAFQAGQLPLDHGFQRQQFPVQPGFNQQSQPGPAGGWASDFQRLNISGPPAQFQQQPFTPQVQQRHDAGGWHQDFARQQGGMPGQAQMTGQTNSPYRYSPMSGMGMIPQYSGGFGGQQEMSIAQQKQPAEAFDEEAFARAFEEAAQAEMASKEAESHQETIQQDSSQAQHENVELGQDVMINESAERLLATEEGLLGQERIGADTIQDPKTQDPKVAQEENSPDALARTAGELLESVRHDQSAKFQNSQFLELMRQFRDKEAIVQGDRIVGAGTINATGGESGDLSDGMVGGEEAIKVAS